MFNVGPLELMVLLVLALIVFGPAKLPELMASAGNAIREFQRASRELTEVFQETQQEFSSALDLENTATTVTEPAAEPSANGHATTEVTTTVPFVPEVPATTAPAEFETAAAMIDPVEPYPAPAIPVAAADEAPPESVPTASAPAELDTAAGLLDDSPPPFEIKFGASEPELVAVAESATASAPDDQPAADASAPTASAAAYDDAAHEGTSTSPTGPTTEPAPAAEAPSTVQTLTTADLVAAPSAGAGAANAASSTPGIDFAAAPLAESGVATAPAPENGALPTRRRAPRTRAKAESAALPQSGSPAPADESA